MSRYRSRHSSAAFRSAISRALMSQESLNGRELSIWSTVPCGSGFPPTVPTRTRRPDAKSTSGVSVSRSTTTSPRMPCGLRMRPMAMSSGSAMLLLVALRDRDCCALQLLGEPRFVALLEDARLAKQRTDGVARFGADAHPVVHALVVDDQPTFRLPGSILSDDLDELAIARALGVGDDDAIHRCLLAADATEADSNCHWCSP